MAGTDSPAFDKGVLTEFEIYPSLDGGLRAFQYAALRFLSNRDPHKLAGILFL